MITEDYCSYEVSKLLKEKGFDETCRAFWRDWDNSVILCNADWEQRFDYCTNTTLEEYNDSDETNVSAPTHQMALKWLREKEIYIEIRRSPNTFLFKYKIEEGAFLKAVAEYKNTSYEEAIEAALKYTLNNLI